MVNSENIGKVLKILESEYKKNRKPIITEISELAKNPFKILIGTLLSLRTKDEVTKRAANKLFAVADTPQDILKLSNSQIEKLIFPVGFYHRKAKNLRVISEIILQKFLGKVPDNLEELLSLPGVGRKTANLVLVLGFDKFAICVDTHVHRISNRLGFVKTKSAKETEFALRKKLSKKHWKIYNDYLVSFGQNICKPISPFCSKCGIEKFCGKISVGKSR
ncbi:MAG: endonuclease III [Candidatus Cloacimonetes bacterium]|nr:endonuclease III [Candidatus Cloacimonadota bacterium]MBL7108440.1 endonuclease III [Candidatus Cloacimonadota bacterium]